MSAPEIVCELIRAFKNDEHFYLSKEYSEARVRAEFIDPLLTALGWHPGPDPRYIEEWKDCVVEKSLDVEDEAHKKRADYTCRIGKTPVLIVEAKKPWDDVTRGPNALQARRYAHSQDVPLTVITNFHRLAVYDGRVPPKKDDMPDTAQLEVIRYEDYVEQWSLLERILGKEAILSGAQREYVQKRISKGILPVGQKILGEIERWREELAQTMARTNRDLKVEPLTDAVGRTIDRILFLRVCEARGMEPEGQLLKLTKGPNTYGRLLEIFHEADARYNSGLFYFKEQAGRGSPDGFTPGLVVEDKPLRQIIEGLYYPKNLTNYDQIPVEILGQVYEQFLGKVIILSPTHKAKVEYKPEVKKAGGVYYTPKYIVEYIVKQTVGKLLDGKTPKDVKTMRVLDPACGSGSFLLGAYEYLLSWHLLYYMKDGPEKHQKEIVPDAREGYRLSLRERRRILLDNIYGVDIDAQAVEVTKLSLLLKVLEGETHDTLESEFKQHIPTLPDLAKNIKFGNSLIGTDIYQSQPDLSDGERKRINPFDWQKEFRAIFKDGGFDTVIGNPPYGAEFPEYVFANLKRNYATHVLRGESYLLFVEKATNLLRSGGQFGYIVPDTYLNLSFTQALRSFLLQNTKLREIVVLPSSVFLTATVDTTLLFFEKAQAVPDFHRSDVQVNVFDKRRPISTVANPARKFKATAEQWFRQHSFNVASDVSEQAVMKRAESSGQTIADIAEMFSGIKAYEIGKGDPPQTKKTRDSKPYTSQKKEDRTFSPLYDGKHVGRYCSLWNNNNWVKYGGWLAAPRDKTNFQGEKILIRKIVGDTLIAAHVAESSFCNTLLFVLKLRPTSKIAYAYVLGILNSSFIGWYFRKKFQISREDTFPQIMIRDILQFPMPNYNRSCHDRLVKLVQRMLKLNADLAEAWTGPEQDRLKREIEATDRQIDALVYESYGLTEEEIAIVEGKK